MKKKVESQEIIQPIGANPLRSDLLDQICAMSDAEIYEIIGFIHDLREREAQENTRRTDGATGD
ncbi:MAG: hypothetical protein CMM86_09420 [Rhodovulum sp.]|nr:hypothetical protein [Rhodovulum sp.]|tara:strand:+ start:373 stop:564 length:192 start_codon:yes stop_codon:yes gene_type:complete